MNPDAEKQNDLLFTQALEAETAGDLPALLSKCDQGLAMAGIAPSREMLFRRLRAHANMCLAAERRAYDATGAKLLQAVIEDAKKVISHSSREPDSLVVRYLSQVHTDCGTALYSLSMTPVGTGRAGELMAEARTHFGKALAINPRNDKALAMLESVKRQAAIVESKNGCFIATAAYGSAMAPEVLVFRNYRDEVLSESSLGRLFIQAYYALSPYIAIVIAKSNFLKMLVRIFLLSPLLRIIRERWFRLC